MENKPNLAKICETCDYSPAFCDGDVCTCESAILYGSNSEIGRENGTFEQRETKRELGSFLKAN